MFLGQTFNGAISEFDKWNRKSEIQDGGSHNVSILVSQLVHMIATKPTAINVHLYRVQQHDLNSQNCATIYVRVNRQSKMVS